MWRGACLMLLAALVCAGQTWAKVDNGPTIKTATVDGGDIDDWRKLKVLKQADDSEAASDHDNDEGSGDEGDDEEDDYYDYLYDHFQAGSGVEATNDLHVELVGKSKERNAQEESHKKEMTDLPYFTPGIGTNGNSDFHFDDEEKKKKKKEDGLLDEYYDEYYEEDYNDDEDYYNDDGDEEDIKDNEFTKYQTDVPTNDVKVDNFFKLSYLYIMLASAILSFTLVIFIFLVCKRSMAKRQAKRHHLTQPFFVSADPYVAGNISKPSPIVKSYQRVPTVPQDLDQPELKPSSLEKPLLT